MVSRTIQTVRRSAFFSQRLTKPQDPQDLIGKDPDLFRSFDLVISVDQPRPFELALSDLRWSNGGDNDPDLPFIVTRKSGNACKFRCQYRELLVETSNISRFVSLPMELPPWTQEKRALVASTIQEQFKPEHNPDVQAYLAIGLAFLSQQESTGSWPSAEDKQKVQENVRNTGSASDTKVQKLIDSFCEQGLAGPNETKLILARLLVLDALKLLTGSGQPINNTNIEEVYRIMAKK
ncbi:hypothetical protein LTR10_019334 [Elasticomyces elasticus]|uniref:Uncharacterized protein n=1 Tax=Exophiala sideris TaxID=1016849 RepID=A0ABR0J1M8_9EURO|nr:hypothetical protein LTR10_019334 [Elasticomyces elasticus]KAK5024335.1 hypothetical protein LTS07_008626 [Exophiala sideris]KAK5030983.1 hypothetical protein LTR13_007996 [Exophiala sideris]KAK5054068.1 hypothetical protein LTR69_009030 [Exophiala sideris]KAK5179576.1 hypothetical protein LTR44_008092 [Eurotiomycetes sp. CCFEE 6388]